MVILSAVSEVADKVLLLELGADDYVTKPFSPRELTARLQAAIRRSQKPGVAPVNLVTFGKVAADFSAMEFSRDGVPVALTANEVKLLKYFNNLTSLAVRVTGTPSLENSIALKSAATFPNIT